MKRNVFQDHCNSPCQLTSVPHPDWHSCMINAWSWLECTFLLWNSEQTHYTTYIAMLKFRQVMRCTNIVDIIFYFLSPQCSVAKMNIQKLERKLKFLSRSKLQAVLFRALMHACWGYFPHSVTEMQGRVKQSEAPSGWPYWKCQHMFQEAMWTYAANLVMIGQSFLKWW